MFSATEASHARAQMGSAATQSAAIGATSLVFGALHAVTPLYFVIATAGGALFGREYLVSGLTAAVATHWAYDWIAFEASVLLAERRARFPAGEERDE